ncbi:MAG: hypothetical protein ACOC4G_07920 [Bacillota bacterium]
MYQYVLFKMKDKSDEDVVTDERLYPVTERLFAVNYNTSEQYRGILEELAGENKFLGKYLFTNFKFKKIIQKIFTVDELSINLIKFDKQLDDFLQIELTEKVNNFNSQLTDSDLKLISFIELQETDNNYIKKIKLSYKDDFFNQYVVFSHGVLYSILEISQDRKTLVRLLTNNKGCLI